MAETENCICRMTHSEDAACLVQKMTDDVTLSEMALTFKCLSDPSRLKIINALLITEMCVHSIARIVKMSQPAVSHHLKQLRQMRLVKCRRDGKAIFYALTDYHIQLLFDLSKTHISEPKNNQGR